MAFLEEEENLLTQIPSPPSPLLRFNFEDSRASTPVSLISLGGEGGTITPSPLKGEGWGEGISWLGGGIPQAHAATDYTSRYPTVNGHKL
ncbi:MAG: hypothetical protein H6767_07940 [Candidatus Peribacteria bacterium]|nr:MAG: hypothetical protein H6767_07940 [Candidatus Peribacteria bacterium]